MSDLLLVARGPETLFGVGRVDRPDPAGDLITGSMPWHAGLRGPDGRPAVGALGVLVDNVLGYSLIASLPPQTWTVSTEIWLDVLAPLPEAAGEIRADGRTLQTGSFSAGTVRDGSGQVVAVGRERGRRIPQAVGELLDRPPEGPLRTASDDVLTLVGLTPTDDTHLRLQVDPVLENPRRMLHGGISFCASEIAATWSRVRAGCSLATTSVHIVHTRAVPTGAIVDFEATTRHAGRSLWVTDVVGTVEGRACTWARISAEAG